MSILFDRKCELHVYLKNTKFVIRNLHMTFDILLTSDSKPSTAKIVIFNLSENTQNLFSDEIAGIEFYAGYGTDLNMLFRGTWHKDVSVIQHIPNGVDVETRIETGDGVRELQDTVFFQSYTRGTLITSIIKDIANSFGMPVVMDFEDETKLLAARSFASKSALALDEICEDFLLTWSIQYGVVEILEAFSAPTRNAYVVRLSSTSGLIGTPTITSKGLTVKSMIVPGIMPKRYMQIDPADVYTDIGSIEERIKAQAKGESAPTGVSRASSTGIYIMDSTRFKGSNFGGAFTCDIVTEFKDDDEG